jgi:hypothetical protein
MIGLIVGIVGLVIIWSVGDADASSKVFYTKAAGTAAIVLLWPGVFLWKLVQVPAVHFQQERERADRLENKDGRQVARGKLWELRREGVVLRNKGKKYRDSVAVEAWKEKFKKWRQAVLENASVYSIDLRHSLDPVDKIAPENVEQVKSTERGHQTDVSLVSEILARLYKVLIPLPHQNDLAI